MVRTNRLVKVFSLLVTAGAMLVGCNTMQYGSTDKPTTPETKPAVASGGMSSTPSTPATPTPVATRPAVAAPTPPVQASAKKIIRVKAGADAPYTDKAGNVWAADSGFDGGDTITRDASLAITGPDGKPSTDPDMFHSERYSMNSYTFTVPNGKYKVNLYFAETYEGIGAIGDRVFSFNVGGKDYKDFDIWKEAGGPDKVKIVSTDVDVSNGKIVITFTPGQQNPCVNAIEIIPS
jgi:hypothetical protein